MTSSPAPAQRGSLLLADISGYTSFLQAVGAAHADMMSSAEIPPAYPLMTSLLSGIADRVVPPFTLSKFEGDAIFVYAPDDEMDLDGGAILACMASCYEKYREHIRATQDLMPCDCSACSAIGELELKFALHHGQYIVQSIAGRQELLGPEVTLAHLLLKNQVSDTIGRSGYALLTESAARHFDVPLEGSVSLVEDYAHYQPTQTYVFALP